MARMRNRTYRRRVLSHPDAKKLSGLAVSEVSAPMLASPPTHDEPSWLIDEQTDEVVAIVTRLPDHLLMALRQALLPLEMQSVARAKLVKGSRTPARTFGYAPRKPQAKAEACHSTSLERDYPDAGRLLASLAGHLGREFHDLQPRRAEIDSAVVHQVRSDWFLDDDSLWTSGVINRSAQLPYHVDGSNFHTWSAMPTLRFATRGGLLHLPEYDIQFPCRDGEVTWFCGRDLVHGVTPMRTIGPNAYRLSVVYYALAKMVDCATYAEETARGRVRRTERERAMAERAREPQV